MKLDSRIIEGKKPLTCFDTEVANGFIGKKCYFSDYKIFFKDLTEIENNPCSDCRIDTLTHIDNTGSEHVFKDDCGHWFNFCLPCEWVKPEEPEKKYRPYTLAEWVDQHEIGEVVRFRNTCNQEFNVMYLGYILDTNDDIQDVRTKGQIMFVSSPYSLQELFEHYEICVNGEWQPFGVIDKQE